MALPLDSGDGDGTDLWPGTGTRAGEGAQPQIATQTQEAARTRQATDIFNAGFTFVLRRRWSISPNALDREHRGGAARGRRGA